MEVADECGQKRLGLRNSRDIRELAVDLLLAFSRAMTWDSVSMPSCAILASNALRRLLVSPDRAAAMLGGRRRLGRRCHVATFDVTTKGSLTDIETGNGASAVRHLDLICGESYQPPLDSAEHLFFQRLTRSVQRGELMKYIYWPKFFAGRTLRSIWSERAPALATLTRAIVSQVRNGRTKLTLLVRQFFRKTKVSHPEFILERADLDSWMRSLFTPEWSRHEEYLEKSDASLQYLELVTDLGPLPDRTLPLITIAHNEMPRLPDFLRHYRELGIGRFIIVDHRSDDKTLSYLQAQPDVHLYHARTGYDKTLSGQMWVTGLARHFAMGRWVLHVDADELLVYDGMHDHSLLDLCGLLEKEGQSRLYAPMIDMYSREPVLRARVRQGKKLLDVAPYFDPKKDGETIFYEFADLPGRVGLFCYTRSRAFGNLAIPTAAKAVGFHMEKFPLSKWHSGTAYCLVHSPFPYDENPRRPRGALLHFRFVGNFIEYNRSVAEMGEAWDGGPHHYAYVDKVSDTPNLTLYHSASRFFEGPQSLISEGLMEPIEWG